MFHTQGHGNRNCKPRRSQSLAGIRNGLAAGLSMMLLASCGGDGSSSAAAGGNNNNQTDENIVRIGNGIGESFVAGQIGILQPNLQSGGSTQLQINFVDGAGNAVTDVISVSISSNCIASSQSSIEGELDTGTGGLTLDYNSNGCTGEDVITASTTTPDGFTIQATGTVTIEEDAVLSVQFIPSEEPVQLALKGVGGNETATVRFRLVGQQSAPIIGESITFSLSTEVGGIALAETTAESNSMGEVTAIVQSGTVHTTVVVTATHDATGVSGNSDGINISTGVPQANRLSLSVEVFNPRAFNLDGNEVGASIIAADQFGNPVPDNTVISFASPEGGTIPSSCATVGGRCSVSWISSDPRPADGRATIIAYTSGAEAFGDSNGNSIFDDGDTFDSTFDLGEPFVDENESGDYDVGEFFVDFNSNGTRDIADGMWNGPLCEHSSLCAADADEVAISETLIIVMATNGVDPYINAGVANPFPPIFGTINVGAGSAQFLQGVMVPDENGNAPAIGTTISFETSIGALEGTTEFDVGSRTEEMGPLSVLFTAPADPGQGVLTMRVEVPDVVVQEFWWNVNISCDSPTGQAAGSLTDTSAILSWTEQGEATSWVVEYGLENFVLGTGTTVSATNPFQLTGLTANTSYDYYVRSVCGGSSSDATGPFQFSTTP